MSLIGSFPSIIGPGDPVASGPVMADFNFIASSINAGSMVSALKTSGVQTFTSTPSKVAFNTVAGDLKSEYDNTLYRFTAQSTGWWLVSVEMIVVIAAPFSSFEANLFLYLNGVAPTAADLFSVTPLIATTKTSITMSGLVPLSVTNYLEVFCSCNAGNITTDAVGGNRFNIIQLR